MAAKRPAMRVMSWRSCALMAIALVFASLLIVMGIRYRREQAARGIVEKLGGSILDLSDISRSHLAPRRSSLRIPLPFRQIRGIDLRQNLALAECDIRTISRLSGLWFLDVGSTRIDDSSVVHLAGLRELNSLSLDRNRVTDRCLSSLAKLPLVELGLDDTLITDTGLRQIGEIRSLKVLRLSGTSVTDAGITSLSELPDLRWINLSRTSVGNAGAQHLARISSLISVSLANSRVTDESMPFLSHSSIAYLDLSLTSVGDQGVAALAGNQNLFHLDLGQTLVTDAGLEQLTSTAIARINLDRTAVTDRGVAALERLQSLQSVELTGTRVTQDAVGRLRKRTPPVDVRSDFIFPDDVDNHEEEAVEVLMP